MERVYDARLGSLGFNVSFDLGIPKSVFNIPTKVKSDPTQVLATISAWESAHAGDPTWALVNKRMPLRVIWGSKEASHKQRVALYHHIKDAEVGIKAHAQDPELMKLRGKLPADMPDLLWAQFQLILNQRQSALRSSELKAACAAHWADYYAKPVDVIRSTWAPSEIERQVTLPSFPGAPALCKVDNNRKPAPAHTFDADEEAWFEKVFPKPPVMIAIGWSAAYVNFMSAARRSARAFLQGYTRLAEKDFSHAKSAQIALQAQANQLKNEAFTSVDRDKEIDRIINTADWVQSRFVVLEFVRTDRDYPGEVKLPLTPAAIDTTSTVFYPSGGPKALGPAGDPVIVTEDVVVNVEIPVDAPEVLAPIKDMPVDEYKASRGPEIDIVRAEVEQGKITEHDAERATADAIAAQDDFLATKDALEKEIAGREKERDKVAAEVDKARALLAKKQGAPEPASVSGLGSSILMVESDWMPLEARILAESLSGAPSTKVARALGLGYADPYSGYGPSMGGLFSKLKKEMKRAWKRVRGAVSRGFKDVADETRRSIKRASTEVSRFGKSIAHEVERVSRRVRKESIRFSKRAAPFVGVLRALSPLLVYIPVVGWILWAVTVVSTISVEIHFSYRMKREMEKAARRRLNALMVEIKAMQDELAKIYALIEQMKLARKAEAGLAATEALTRHDLSSVLVESIESHKRRQMYWLLGAGAGGALLIGLKPHWLTVALAAGALAGAYYYTRSTPPQFQPFYDCIEVADPAMCRELWIEANFRG